MRVRTALLALPAAFAMTLLGTAAPANAEESVNVQLDELNSSGATGTATLSVTPEGDLEVAIEAEGLVPNSPHAQHIHGSAEGHDFQCPDESADADGDGIITTTEGLPSYGDIFISLTTEGDTSKDSGLAVDRMPVADEDGSLSYERTIPAADLPEGTADHLHDLHIVQHGIDTNGNDKYDGERKSDLDPALPAEATDPADCGMVTGAAAGTTPSGGVETGGMGTHGVDNSGWFTGGGIAVLTVGILLFWRRRLTD